MSVLVDIQIAGGAAYRRLYISCIERPPHPMGQPRDQDEVGLYEVECQNALPARGEIRTARFHHRYGDDVTVLIAKAGEALREKYDTTTI